MTQPQYDPESKNNQPTYGQFLDHYPIRNQTTKRSVLLFIGGLSVIASITLTLMLAAKMWTGIQWHGRAVLLGIFPNPLSIYAAIFLIGSIMIILALIHWKDGLTLYEAGILRYTANKGQFWSYQQTKRFDSYITQIHFGGSVVETRAQLILEDGSGKRWVIRNRYHQMSDLINSIRSNILPELILRAHQKLLSGETLIFHKALLASQFGVEVNGECLTYCQVEPLIKNHILKLTQDGNPKKVLFKSKITKIRNLDVLIDLFENPPHPIYQSSPK